MIRVALPLSIGDAGHGRGRAILDGQGLEIARGLPFAEEEIVCIVNAHEGLIDALRGLVDDTPCATDHDWESYCAVHNWTMPCRNAIALAAIAAATGKEV